MYKYKINLQCLSNIDKNMDLRILSRGVNRLLTNWIDKGNHQLTTEMKAENTLRPMNISHLRKEKDCYSFCATFLEDQPLFQQAFLQGIEDYDNSKLDLNYNIFKLESYKKIAEIQSVDLYKYVEKHLDKEKITFNFNSDTSFVRRGSKGEYCVGESPFPEPGKIYESVLNRWNHFGFTKFDPEEVMLIINDCLRIDSCSIDAQTFSLGYSGKKSATITGFMGQATFSINTKNEDFRKIIIFLALYAEWCGVGKKTNFGLGQVKVSFR